MNERSNGKTHRVEIEAHTYAILQKYLGPRRSMKQLVNSILSLHAQQLETKTSYKLKDEKPPDPVIYLHDRERAIEILRQKKDRNERS